MYVRENPSVVTKPEDRGWENCRKAPITLGPFSDWNVLFQKWGRGVVKAEKEPSRCLNLLLN